MIDSFGTEYTIDDLIKEMAAEGYSTSESTLRMVYNDLQSSFKVLIAKGWKAPK